ncbi:MAG: hypothetical protein C0425_06200 [Chlorobiaceae bacterium]|nr:hypothetical protein [Chlorobiaceae bacterium]MBA4309911.1 hypothetical protein [Chlorobiaceae bacterium]
MFGKGLLIFVLGVISIGGYIFSDLFFFSDQMTRNTVTFFNSQSANNVAHAGANMALRQLANNSNWRTGFNNLNVMGGRLNVTLHDVTFDGQSTILIRSIGIAGLNTDEIVRDTQLVYVRAGAVAIPTTVRGAITTNNNVRTLGNLVVDGRNYSAAGNLLSGTGTFAFWSTRNIDQGGSSSFGGTSSGSDIVPSSPANASIFRENQIFAGGFPSTPDSVLGGTAMGFPPGRLKQIAMSGVNGSQYTTDPRTLTHPLRGVTFVELPSGDNWGPANITGSGVLVVSNSARNAEIRNINWGPFNGLMIADDVTRIHTDILGGLIVLSNAPPSGNTIGNGNGRIRYSSETIQNAVGLVRGFGTGGGSHSMVVAWRD